MTSKVQITMNINTAVSQDITLCHLGDRLRQLVTVGPGTVHMGLQVDKVSLKQVSVHYFCFPSQYRSHQCSALFIHLLPSQMMSLNNTLKGQSSEEFSFSAMHKFPHGMLCSAGDYTHMNLPTEQLYYTLCAVTVKHVPYA